MHSSHLVRALFTLLLARIDSSLWSDYPDCVQSVLENMASQYCGISSDTTTNNQCLCTNTAFLTTFAEDINAGCSNGDLTQSAQVLYSDCADTFTPLVFTQEEFIQAGNGSVSTTNSTLSVSTTANLATATTASAATSTTDVSTGSPTTSTAATLSSSPSSSTTSPDSTRLDLSDVVTIICSIFGATVAVGIAVIGWKKQDSIKHRINSFRGAKGRGRADESDLLKYDTV